MHFLNNSQQIKLFLLSQINTFMADFFSTLLFLVSQNVVISHYIILLIFVRSLIKQTSNENIIKTVLFTKLLKIHN